MTLKNKLRAIAMGVTLRDAKEKCSGYAIIVNEHLAKLYYNPNDLSKNTWYKSIWSHLLLMHDMRVNLPSRKKLTYNYHTFLVDLDSYSRLCGWRAKAAYNAKSRPKPSITIYESGIELAYEVFYKHVALLLSSKLELDQQQIYWHIDRLQETIQHILKD